MTRRSCSSCWSPCPRQYTRSPNICDGRSACYGRRSEDEVTRRMSAILGEYSPAGQGCTRHFSVPPLEYKNYTSYKKYRPNFGLNIQESYGKRPMVFGPVPDQLRFHTLALPCCFWLFSRCEPFGTHCLLHAHACAPILSLSLSSFHTLALPCCFWLFSRLLSLDPQISL